MFVAKLRVAPILQFVKNLIKVGGEKIDRDRRNETIARKAAETTFRAIREIVRVF